MLISFCGIDGCGKTSQVNLLRKYLEKLGKQCSIVKAYDDATKETIRSFIESWDDDIAITFLFQALHAQQYTITSKILSEGGIVIADRWDESYLSYHSSFGDLADQEELRNQLNALAFRNLLPDFGIVIDVPAEIARHRRESRGDMERFEDRPDEYYEIIRKKTLQIAHDRNWMIVNGKKPLDDIHEEIIQAISKFI